MADYTSIEYHVAESGVAEIVLAKPDTRNAQNKRMLYELNDAFDRVGRDKAVKVAVLTAQGPHFSSGHDMGDREPFRDIYADYDQVTNWGGFGLPGQEGHWAYEEEMYLGLCWRWVVQRAVEVDRSHERPLIARTVLLVAQRIGPLQMRLRVRVVAELNQRFP